MLPNNALHLTNGPWQGGARSQVNAVFCGRQGGTTRTAIELALRLLGLACLSGCLYEQPLAPGEAKPIERQVLGAWRCVAPDSDELAILTVTDAADGKYRAEFGGGTDSPSIFSVYAVRFEGNLLLNAQEIDKGEARKWTLARYTLYRPTVLHIEFAEDEPFRKAATQGDRVAILKRALKQGPLFQDYCTCIRIAKD